MTESLAYLSPELLVLGTALAVLLGDLWVTAKRRLAWLAFAGLVWALWATVSCETEHQALFNGMMVVDPLAHFFRVLVLAGSGLVLGLTAQFPGIPDERRGAFFALLLLATLSMMLMALSNDLLMLFLTIEFLGITSYILVGFMRHHLPSSEGAVKYFLVGAFSSAVMLYGMSLLYGLARSTNLYELAAWYAGYGGGPNDSLLTAAIFFLLVGFGFKVAMAPFHMWVPDVYQGAPTPVTVFLAVASKAAGFAVLLRVFLVGLPAPVGVLAVLAAVTMTLGNLLAIPQKNVKRLLAYSSIGHAGYVVMGLVASQASARAAGASGMDYLVADLGLQGVLVYLVAYTLMNVGAFAVVIAVANRAGGEDIEQYAGLSHREPLLAGVMTLFLLSLAGIPPTVGFVAKFYVISATIQSGLIWLAVVAGLNSAIAVFYYLRIAHQMYFVAPAPSAPQIAPSRGMQWMLGVMAIGVLWCGIFPESLAALVQGPLLWLH